MKSNIPLYVISYKKNKRFAEKTANHLRKYFSSVNIFYGLDIKSPQNTEGITGPQVLHYNLEHLIEQKNLTKPFIYTEDDVRITHPQELLKYIKGGFPGSVNRLIYFGGKNVLGGTMMVGIKNPQEVLRKLQGTRRGHLDQWLNKYYPNQVKSPNFGINFYDRPSTTGWHIKTAVEKKLVKQAEMYKRGERESIPIANRRYLK